MEKYEALEMETVEFEVDDVIATSDTDPTVESSDYNGKGESIVN